LSPGTALALGVVPVSRNSGFTLVELLVVVAVVAVLAAVAIPEFRQSKAYDARLFMDARNAASAEEAYFDDHSQYYQGACDGLPNLTTSPGVVCAAALVGPGYEIRTSHPQASKSCTWSTETAPSLICS
jgi:prepilin-type N-terminal cleavage/methylation domain-containing protein